MENGPIGHLIALIMNNIYMNIYAYIYIQAHTLFFGKDNGKVLGPKNRHNVQQNHATLRFVQHVVDEPGMLICTYYNRSISGHTICEPNIYILQN